MVRWLPAVWVLVPALQAAAVAAAADFPPGSKVEIVGRDAVLEPFERKDGVALAQTQVKVTTPIPQDAEAVYVKGRAGKEKSGLTATFVWDDGPATQLFAKAGGDDGCLQLPWNMKLYVRPDVTFYGNPQRKAKVLAGWAAFPAASEHLVRFEIRRVAQGAQVWIDGRFAQELNQKGRLKAVEVSVPKGGGIQAIGWSGAKASKYLPLSAEEYARPATWTQAVGDLALPNAMANAALTLTPGDAVVEGIPFRVAPAARNIDLAGLGWLQCPSDDLVSFYWRRNAWIGLPESCIFSVPQDTYLCAHILCAAEDDAAKWPEFNVRLTRYANGRGDAMADTPVRLPRGKDENVPNARQAGTVTYGPENARKTAPLWLLRVPLKTGRIQDLLREDEKKYGFGYPVPTPRYLDLELMDPLTGVDESDVFPPPTKHTPRTYTPQAKRSAVHVFGVTLESSPAELTVRANVPVHAFYASDNPALLAEVQARQEGKYEVAWEIADVEGAIAASGKKELTLAAGEKGETVSVPVTVGAGWYATRFRLLDGAGRELVDHRGSFVMLPPDTRKAGFDSPHGTWWFHWAHGGAPDIARVGPILQRCGLRHTILPKSLPETATAPHKVTCWCVFWKGPKKGSSVAEWLSDSEEHIRQSLKDYPNCLKSVMLYHESDSYNAPFPSELWGEKPPPLQPKDDENWKHRMEYVSAWTKMVRENFPELKIQIGNCGDGCAMVGQLIRSGLRPEDYDYVAVEDLGQTFIPEKPALGAMQSAWFLRQTARKLGNPKAQITGCYEWIGRRNVALGLAGQAEWYVRDALQARALGFHSIALGTVHDAGAGYFHTIWGAGGLCWRYPYMYPKPSYAALATLTRVLDCAKFERLVPTGSLSLYALEFKRDDEFVYAIWAPRGCRETKLTFGGEAALTLTDVYGREKTSAGRELTISASTAAHYVTTKTRVASVSAGKSWFPADEPPKSFAAVEPMDSLKNWSVGELKWLEHKTGSNFPHRMKGNFELREADDQEKGKCLEIELKPEGQVWEMLHEHVYLKLTTPLTAAGPCEYVGVWVKGNSSWGDVLFEVKGADGGGKLLGPDWSATTSISFDGWNFIRFKLPDGPNWRSKLQLVGLVVSVPRQMLYATEMVPVPDLKVRLKGFCCF